jgi:hypothetical protein
MSPPKPNKKLDSYSQKILTALEDMEPAYPMDILVEISDDDVKDAIKTLVKSEDWEVKGPAFRKYQVKLSDLIDRGYLTPDIDWKLELTDKAYEDLDFLDKE